MTFGERLVFLRRYARQEGTAKLLGVAWNVATLAASARLGRRYVCRTIHGNRMYLRVGDRGVSRALALFGGREELETEVVRREIREGMTVLDLGANIGYYTLLTASLVGPSGKVYAVEPFGESFELLLRNIQLNRLDGRVESFRLAISDSMGTALMYLGEAANLHTLVSPDAGRSTRPAVEVATTTLDEFLRDKSPIDFLRMDVEGGECQVFDGMQEVLKQSRRPLIFFEVHPVGTVDPDPRYTPRLDRLLAAGYRCRYAISSFHPTSLEKYAALGYKPEKVGRTGQAIFRNIRSENLLAIAARRPKITRALLLAPEPR